jgi:hypothetical protein
LEACPGGRGASLLDQRAGGVVEEDGCVIGEGGAVVVERDCVLDFLSARLEGYRSELNECPVTCLVGGILRLAPGAEAGAALSGLESGISGGFGQGSTAFEKQDG